MTHPHFSTIATLLVPLFVAGFGAGLSAAGGLVLPSIGFSVLSGVCAALLLFLVDKGSR